MTVRKAKNGELNKLIDLANEAFRPVRTPNYDFAKRLPKIYNSNIDYSNIHFVIESDDGFRAVAGNLIKTINIGNKKYLFSNIGTVATKPKYQNLGYMSRLLKEIDGECIEKKVDFSILTGKRSRYNRIGYELAGGRYVYDIISKNEAKKYDIMAMNSEDIDICYDIYLNNQAIILRDKNEFLLTVKNINLTSYVIRDNNKIIGYFIYDKKTESINEISISNVSQLKDIMESVLIYFNLEKTNLIINPLNIDIVNELDKHYVKYYTEEILIKVYNLKSFIEMILDLNKDKLPLNAKEIYMIEDKVISISITNGIYSVDYVDNHNVEKFSYFDFIRFILGNDFKYKSQIFPLCFDIKDADLF